MSKLDELIAELCPDGVEYMPVGELCSIQTGSQINKENFKNVGEYPVYNGGINPSGYHDDFNTEANTIAISQGGASAGFVNWVDVPFFAGAHCYTIKNVSKLILNRYLYFYLKNKQDDIQNSKHGAGIPGLNSRAIKNLRIPVPPLPVQQEIVRILDNFTELTTQLTAELKARKKQYEYYRDWLLSQEELNKLCPDGVSYKRLGEIGYFYGGLSGKSKHDFANGNAKFITYMNVYSNLAVDTEISDMVKIGENEKQNTVKHGDILFTGSSETLDECGISSVLTKETNEKLYLNSFCFGFRLIDKDLLLPDFSKYLFRSKEIRKQIIRTASGVTRFNVSREKMEQVIIPVPPLPVQQKIVRILDNFTELIAQLETELEARQKQYEYYRDKLLTFPARSKDVKESKEATA